MFGKGGKHPVVTLVKRAAKQTGIRKEVMCPTLREVSEAH